MSHRLPISIALLLLANGICNADLIVDGSLSNESWTYPLGTSPTLHVRVKDPGNAPTSIGSWAIALRVVGLPGSTGNVDFAGAATPSDYLFLGRGLPTGPVIVGSPGELSALDIDFGEIFSLPSVVVPPAGGSLVDVTFLASPDASGPFAIEVLPFQFPDGGSYWTAAGEFEGRSFLNAGDRIATILLGPEVSVPEPPGLLTAILTLLVATTVALSRARKLYGRSINANTRLPRVRRANASSA